MIFIGIIALIFLGPRKLPEYARKIGKIMYTMRNTANEFKTTWEREVDFEEEISAFDVGRLETEAERPAPRSSPKEIVSEARAINPEIREVDPSEMTDWRGGGAEPGFEQVSEPDENVHPDEYDKRSWL